MAKKPPSDKATAEQLRIQGNALFYENKFDKCIKKYKESIQADPKDKVNAVMCHVRISWAYARMEKTDKNSQAKIHHREKAFALGWSLDGTFADVIEQFKCFLVCLGASKAFCFSCVCFCLVVGPSTFFSYIFSARYIIGVGLLGLLLTKIINAIVKRWERKKKQDDERKLHEKKREEEMNEAKQKSELKQRKLDEKKQRLDKKKQRLNEKMQEDQRNDAKRKEELEEKKIKDEQEERERTKMENIFKQEQELKVESHTEIKSSPRPDAVCRWEKCEQVQSEADIIPSQNIYFSDPDFKGYYKVCCRSNCQVSYHKSCWLSVKGENGEKVKLAKCPTEKEFLGQTCFTPDCGDIIVKIEIMEDSGKTRIIQDVKLNEQLQADEKKRREEAQIKKKRKKDEEGFKIYENRQIKKIQSKKKSPVSLTSVSPNPNSSTSSVSFARDVSRVPQVVKRPFLLPTPPLGYKGNLPSFPGNPEAGFSVPTPPVLPKINPRPGITLKDFFTPPASRSTFSPTSQSSPVPQIEVAEFEVDVPNHKKASQAGSSANYSSTEATLTGATDTFLTSSRPTSTGAIPKTDQPGAKTGDKYDSLVAKLQINHPSLCQDQARAYVMELRQSNNGKLSGMKRREIFNKVASFIQRDKGFVDSARFTQRNRGIEDGASVTQRDRGIVDDARFEKRDRGIVDGASFEQRDRGIEDGARFMQRDRGIVDGASFEQRDRGSVDVADEEDNNCSVCLEDMLDSDSVYLNPCRHRFHTDCINQWLDSPGGAGSTCPMCRNYIIKENEYPSLGRSFRRF